MIPFILPVLLFLVGLYAMVAKRNIIKIAIGFCLMEYAVNCLFALIGYKNGGIPPIFTKVPFPEASRLFVDPIPQALVLTAIVIGLGTTALLLAIALRVYEKYQTFDVSKIRRLKG